MKIDYQKINSLKAKVYDKMVEFENYQKLIQVLQQDIIELNKQIEEEQNKISVKK